jgi:hypothetical protein
MAETVSLINTAADGFQTWVDRTNTLLTIMSSRALTANSSANGAVTTGNTLFLGIFAGTLLAANTLRGGNVQTSGPLTISSNVIFSTQYAIGNSTVNALANSSQLLLSDGLTTALLAPDLLSLSNAFVVTASSLRFGNTTANLTGTTTSLTFANSTGNTRVSPGLINVGSLSISQTAITLGNSTVNASLNSASLNFGNLVANSTTLSIGNSTVNVQINSSTMTVPNFVTLNNISLSFLSLGNSTVNAYVNSIGIFMAGGFVTANQNTLRVGNSTSNVSINSTALSVGGLTLDVGLLTGVSGIFQSSLTSTGTSAQLFDSFAVATYRAAEYLVSIKDNTANGYQTEKMMLYFDGSGVDMTEYAIMYSNTQLATFSANANSTHVTLFMTPTVANSTAKYSRTTLGV